MVSMYTHMKAIHVMLGWVLYTAIATHVKFLHCPVVREFTGFAVQKASLGIISNTTKTESPFFTYIITIQYSQSTK